MQNVLFGAEKVTLWLKEHDIQYKTEYKFKDLFTGKNHYLRFDFAIFDEKELVCLIEYQGQQHYKTTINDNFGKRQREVTDPMKKEYCKNKNINLFEIRYDDKIENRLYEIMNTINIKYANPVPSSE